jgi:UDP-3-O-[3-hydroxymyristoyl] glucosamine N-acyltransferase LpxD
MLETLLEKFAGYNDTCSILDLRDLCVTFIKDKKYFRHIEAAKKDIWLIAPYGTIVDNYPFRVHITKHPEYEFVLYHNEIHKNHVSLMPEIGVNCNIHPSALMGVDGLRLVTAPDGTRIHFKHTGYILIGDNVDIGPYTVIHRGTMLATKVGSGTKIGSMVNIGHNCNIGMDNTIAVGVIFNGGVKTGKNCTFWSGSVIKNYITICDDVIIGQGSVVTKDIIKPGVYVGNPAKFLKLN